MAGPAPSKLGMGTPYAPRLVVGAWVVAGWAGVAYGLFLTVTALRSPPGAELTGQFMAQPVCKAAMALLLAVGAVAHPIVRERRWLMPALLSSAVGDGLLAISWWTASFVLGLASFLLAQLCFLGALIPLAARSWPRLTAVAVTCVACAALLARLPTVWTGVGAVFFAVSDAMIGIGRFVLGNETLAVPIWWAYATAQILITAGFFFGRVTDGVPAESPGSSAASATPAE